MKTFERIMGSYEIPKEYWSFKLAPQLIGKAQQAYAAMSADESGRYDNLKVAILTQFGINEESYKQRFRQARRQQDETNKEFGIRLMDLVQKWMLECKDIQEKLTWSS